jgi:hypothetical protein
MAISFAPCTGLEFLRVGGTDRRTLEHTIEVHRPDVILCHFGHVALRLIGVATSKRIPLVAHFHGMDLSSMLEQWVYRSSLRRYHPLFAASVIVGAHQFEAMRSLGWTLATFD